MSSKNLKIVKILLLCIGAALLIFGSGIAAAIGSEGNFSLSTDYVHLLPTLAGAAILIFLIVYHFIISKKQR